VQNSPGGSVQGAVKRVSEIKKEFLLFNIFKYIGTNKSELNK